MSKVKIQGNASGTGVLTVTAPNTSTDRTITLPDSTDTLAVNSDVTNKLPLAGGTLTGNLGINTTTPSTLLEVKANSNSTTDYPITVLNSAESVTTGYGAYGIDQSASSAYTIDVHDDLIIKSNTGENLRVLENGGLTFNGDTAAANALSDYEEGTFTVTMGTGGGSITLSSSQNLLVYTKIGNLVSIGGRVLVSSVSSPSGEISINGLPFSAAHGSGEGTNHQNISVHFRNAASDVGGVTGQTSTNNIHIYEAGTTGNTNVNDKIQANTYIMIGGVYRTAS